MRAKDKRLDNITANENGHSWTHRRQDLLKSVMSTSSRFGRTPWTNSGLVLSTYEPSCKIASLRSREGKMTEIHHVWTEYNPWQDTGTQGWDWPLGEGQHYWGFSVRPFQNNSETELVGHWATSDNNGNYTEHFTVRNGSPGLIRFSAFWAIGA